MIQKQKSQLFNSPRTSLIILLLALACFFILAVSLDQQIFPFIQISLVTVLFYVVVLRVQLARQLALLDLEHQALNEQVNLIDAAVQGEDQNKQALNKKISDFSKLKGLTEILSNSFNLSDTVNNLSQHVTALFGDRDVTVILYLFQSRTGELGLSMSQKGQMHTSVKNKKGDGYDQWAVKTMTPLLVEDVRNDFRFDADKIETIENRNFRSLMIVPLKIGEKTVGLLRVDSPIDHFFDSDDLRLMTAVAGLGAVAIENAQLYERIEDLAIHDSLTGLLLRRHLLDRMTQEMGRELRANKELSFVMIDLDDFKKYNDEFGHVAGDVVLKTVGKMLKDFFSEPGDIVCRYGGEEFSVLLPDCPKERALEMAEDIRQQIESQEIILRREKTKVTVSIGVAAFPTDARIKDELIQKADQALYEAKDQGRNKVCGA